jgi:hypothetical protein
VIYGTESLGGQPFAGKDKACCADPLARMLGSNEEVSRAIVPAISLQLVGVCGGVLELLLLTKDLVAKAMLDISGFFCICQQDLKISVKQTAGGIHNGTRLLNCPRRTWG